MTADGEIEVLDPHAGLFRHGGLSLEKIVDKTFHGNNGGTPGGKDETVSIALFTKSWATSDDRMIVTEETG